VTYWPSGGWTESHSTPGAAACGSRWGFGDGRVGFAAGYETYLLLVNPFTGPLNLTLSFYRVTGAPVIKHYSIDGRTRLTVHVNSDVPELANELFGTEIRAETGRVCAEQAVYWDVDGVRWTAAVAVGGTRLTP
jgi:hypothetical protein